MTQTYTFHVPAVLARYMPDVRREDARCSWTDAPSRRLLAELYCLVLVFLPHQYNNDNRKYLTLLFFGVWAAIEVGAAFNVAMLPPQFVYIRALVLILFGRMWGLELNNVAGIKFTNTNDEGDNGGS